MAFNSSLRGELFIYIRKLTILNLYLHLCILVDRLNSSKKFTVLCIILSFNFFIFYFVIVCVENAVSVFLFLLK